MALAPPAEREKFLLRYRRQPEALRALKYQWRGFLARPDQLPPPGDWVYGLIRAGRGYGKSRIGAQWSHEQAMAGIGPGALIGETPGEVRGTMIEGVSGILSVVPPGERPHWEPSFGVAGKLTWPNGVIALCYSGANPDSLRGPNVAWAWCDELSKWAYSEAVFRQLEYTLRAGDHPRAVITTTPRPIKIIRELIEESKIDNPICVVTAGSSYRNRANLAPIFLDRVIRRHEGTRLGRQEIHGEVLDDVPGALWSRDQIEQRRWPITRPLPEFARIVVAIDPAESSNIEDIDKSHFSRSETGIIAAGRTAQGQGFVLEDGSGIYSPTEWAQKAVALYRKWGADRIVAEINAGGEMVGATIWAVDKNLPFRAIHAHRGKGRRAEPVSALYEARPGEPTGRIFHYGAFPELEDQLVELTIDFDTKVEGYSPDRADAHVHAFTDLFLEEQADEPLWSKKKLQVVD